MHVKDINQGTPLASAVKVIGDVIETMNDENEKLRACRDRLVEALEEAILQIEYLHKRFETTGSGNSTITKAKEALKAVK